MIRWLLTLFSSLSARDLVRTTAEFGDDAYNEYGPVVRDALRWRHVGVCLCAFVFVFFFASLKPMLLF